MLAAWVAEASGHGDFESYHLRFNHPASAVKRCPCGRKIDRAHIWECPIANYGNPLAGRRDPRGFERAYELYRDRLPRCRTTDDGRRLEIVEGGTTWSIPRHRTPTPTQTSAGTSA